MDLHDKALPPKTWPATQWVLDRLGVRGVSVLALALGLLLTLLVWLVESRHAERALHTEFEAHVREAVDRIEQRIAVHEQLLLGAAAAVTVSGRFAAADLHSYAASMQVARRFEGLDGLGLVEMLAPDAGGTEADATVVAGGDGGLGLPRRQRALLAAVEPLPGGQPLASGEDLWAEPVVRAMLEQARDTGRAALSGRTLPVAAVHPLASAVIWMGVPLFASGDVPATTEERRRRLSGWAVLRMRLDDTMAGVLGARADEIDVELFDGAGAVAERLLFDADRLSTPLDTARPTMSETRAMPLAGRLWTLYAHTRPGFAAQHDYHNLSVVMAAGIALSAALALLAGLLTSGRERARALAERMTADLRASEAHLRQIGDNLPGSFVYQFTREADGTPRVTYISSGVRAVLGLTPEEVMSEGSALMQRIDPPQLADYAQAEARSLADMADFAMDLRARGAGDAWRWLQFRSHPSRAADGRVVWDGAATDITERKAAEDALRLSEQRWAFAIEGAGHGVWDWNVASGEVQFSRRWKEMLGFAADELRPHVDEWKLRVHPEDLPRVLSDVQAHLDGRSAQYVNEHRVACKDGRWKWILDRGMVIARDAHGAPLRMIGTHTDIDDAKRVETELRDAQARYERVLEGTDAGLWEWNLETGAIDVSERFETMLGYEPGEWVRGHANWLLHADPDQVPETMQAFERHLAGDTPGFSQEFRLRTKNGEWIWVHSRGKVMRRDAAGKPVIVSGTHVDITARKRDAQALLDAERRFRDLVDSTDGIVWEADARSFAFTYVSDQALRLLGHPLEDWKRPGFWAEHIHPDDRPGATTFCANSVAALKAHDFEYRFMARDGRSVWLRDIVTVVAQDGKPRWLRGVMVDITRQKKMEAELRALATTDTLTGLANRREFMSRLAQEHARLRRLPTEQVTVMIFDVDYFKRINDSCGHAAGDEVLRWMGECVRSELRLHDVGGRIGGEEFAIILAQCDVTTARHLAERLRRRVAEAVIETEAGAQAVTISIGLAALDAADAGGDAALNRADDAMYRAKRAGRNRVES